MFRFPRARSIRCSPTCLVDEAVEVVREKRHSLPIDQVTTVVALAGTDDAPREVGRLSLVTPGELPPPVIGRSPLHFGAIGFDPIEQEFATGEPEPIPALADRARGDDLAPLTDEVRLPKAVEVGLRAQGIDPETMSAGELVRGTLSLFGYQIAPGIDDSVSFASKAGQRTSGQGGPIRAGRLPRGRRRETAQLHDRIRLFGRRPRRLRQRPLRPIRRPSNRATRAAGAVHHQGAAAEVHRRHGGGVSPG